MTAVDPQVSHEQPPEPGPGLLRRALSRLSSSTVDLEAEELRESAEAAGCAPIARCSDRDVVMLHGVLSTVTLRPRAGVCTLEAELDDGSATITLVWLGQRRITGVSPGRPMTVHGRVSRAEDKRVMYNPRYEFTG
ncbi:MAG: OB-fold nucleic acid binding domain-containing protein [Actinomycetota bacterium]|nr:OB-fold nucleic acid binding domain-containing protein [Actinomycetota bacterium]